MFTMLLMMLFFVVSASFHVEVSTSFATDAAVNVAVAVSNAANIAAVHVVDDFFLLLILTLLLLMP
jgi:hypothetical protein